MVRVELAQPGLQVVDEAFYNQAFTMHASFMLFLFIIPILAGFGNYAVPLQIGAPDMAFPRINALSFWLLPLGGALMASGFFVSGGAAASGWTEYPPLSGGQFSGTGTDLWIMGLVLIGTSSILGAINFLVTIFRMRAPGMTLFRMPILAWTVLVTSVLVLMATPVLTSALIMLFIDRNYGGHFFDPANGGNAVLYQNVFWFYSHPAVYIMVLPAMGIVSEVLPVFSRKPLFGYKAFVFATVGIGALGFSVWAHHMFTTGPVFLPFFALMTFLIAVPTGVKMFNWIATMWRGKLVFKTPLLFAIGFLTMFLIGGLNGAFSAAVPVDFALHDTYWVVAHLHYVLFGGSVFGVFAGHLLLVPEDDRPDAQRDAGQGPVRADVHRVQPDVLPDAPAGPDGHAAPDRRLRRDRRLERAQPRRPRSAGSSSRPRCCRSCGTSSCRCATARSPATTRGRPTRSSGRPRRRRRPTTSTTCPRSGPSGRCSTPGTAGRRPTERERAMTSATPTATRARPARGPAQPHARAASATPSSGCCCSSPPR